MKKYVVDRVEGTLAVCEAEDRTMHNIPLSELPNGAKPGDVIVQEGDKWRRDIPESMEADERIIAKMNHLWG